MNANHRDLSAIFGPRAQFSEYAIGQRVRYVRDGHIQTGEIIWITPADESHPLEYWVGLCCLSQTDILEAVEEEEPDTAILVQCPYCHRTHAAEGVEWCWLKKERKER